MWLNADSRFLTLFFFFYQAQVLTPSSPPSPPLPSQNSFLFRNHAVQRASVGWAPFFLAGCWCSLICTLFIAGTHTEGKSCLELTVSKVKWIWLLASVVGDQGFQSDTYFWIYYKNCFRPVGAAEITALHQSRPEFKAMGREKAKLTVKWGWHFKTLFRILRFVCAKLVCFNIYIQ